MTFILIKAFNLLFNLLEFFILIDVVLSWVYRGRNNITDIIHIFTEPFLRPGRKIQDRFIPNTPLDFSPIIAIFIIWILRNVINVILGVL